jgi:hypothetical protein
MKFKSTQEIFANSESRKGLAAWTYNKAELNEI